MSSNPKDFSGPFVAFARGEAHPGKADELAQWFANLKARADSKEEPGTGPYLIYRSGDSFSILEGYADYDALVAHTEKNPLFQEFLKVMDSLAKPPTSTFWPANSLPGAAVKF